MNRLSKMLVTLAGAVCLTVPVCAEGQVIGGNFGGLDSLLMATALLAFGFILQKFIKK